MTELFETSNEKRVILKRCDCRLIMKNKKKEKAPEETQPMVYLRPSLDIKYFSGQCAHCKKLYTERVK